MVSPRDMDFPPASVYRIGTKRVAWRDFWTIVRQCKQPWKQVWAGIAAEIGGPTDAFWTEDNQSLMIRGRWSPKHLDEALKAYVKNGLTCTQCHKITPGLHKRKVCGPCYSTDGKLYSVIGSASKEGTDTVFDLGKECQQYYDGWEFGGNPPTKSFSFFNVPKQHVELAQRRATKKKYTLNVSVMEENE